MVKSISKWFQSRPRYRVGVALSGGGAKGFSHIGALKALEKSGYKPEIVAGVSAGSIVGALYCDGYTPAEIASMFDNISYSDMLKIKIPVDSFFSMEPFSKFLEKYLVSKRIEDLHIPLVILATDFDKGCIKEFREGPLIDAVVASCSVPAAFPPVVIDGVHYVDGGVLQNLPASVIRKESETLIGINVVPLTDPEYKKTIVSIAYRSFRLMARENTLEDKALCDILVETKEAEEFTPYDIRGREELIQIGYKSTMDTLNQLKQQKK
ncbi:patatin-like phospholipase family protein [Porphyromonadaceae bacterium]